MDIRITGNWQVHIERCPASMDSKIYVFRTLENGRAEVLHGDKGAVVVEQGYEWPRPTFVLDHWQLQALADALDQDGYKPQKGFLEGKLEATQKHLEDMRRLAFDK